MLRLLERRHAAVLDHAARASVIGGKGEDNIAVKSGELLRQIPRPAFDLEVRAVSILREDTQIARRSRHDLRQAIGSDRAFGPDHEPAFLPDQRLDQGPPLYDGQARRTDAGMTMGFLRYADDKLLDVLSGIAEHLIASGVWDRGQRSRRPPLQTYPHPAAVFKARDHSRYSDASSIKAGLGIENGVENRKLFPLNL